MSSKFNSQVFGKTDIEKGLHIKFIEHLIKINLETEEGFYNDIHIKNIEDGIIVEWNQCYLDEDGHFEFVDTDQVVMLEREMPDKSLQFFFDEDDYKEQLQNFLTKHPNFYQNEYGRWVDKDEEEKLSQYIKSTFNENV